MNTAAEANIIPEAPASAKGIVPLCQAHNCFDVGRWFSAYLMRVGISSCL